MEQVTLPRSGWRFVERRADGEGTVEKDPAHKLWYVPGAMPENAPAVGGFNSGGRKAHLCGRGGYIFLWGFVDGEVQVAAIGRLGRRRQLPVYRVGRNFWVTETDGRARYFQISASGHPEEKYDPPFLRMATARGRRRRRKVQRAAGMDVQRWEG